MKKKIFFLLVLFLSPLVLVQAHDHNENYRNVNTRHLNIDPNISLDSIRRGDVMGNGGGLAEQNIMYAYRNIKSFIDICLDSNDCRLEKNEKVILQKIKNNMAREYRGGQIVFKSERDEPGTFILDGEPKIAKTWLYIEAPIFIRPTLLEK